MCCNDSLSLKLILNQLRKAHQKIRVQKHIRLI